VPRPYGLLACKEIRDIPTLRYRPATSRKARAPQRDPARLSLGRAALSSTTSTGGWSASSSRTATTRSVLWPMWIVIPGAQFGAALLNDDGSAGVPSADSSLNRNPAIRSSLPFSAAAERHDEHTTARPDRLG
jgi:hypothetical protein